MIDKGLIKKYKIIGYSVQVTWILKRNKCINIVRGDDLGWIFIKYM